MLEIGYKIVFIDGFLSLDKSQFPESIVCFPMDEAVRTFGLFFQNYMVDPRADDGVFIYIPPKVEVALSIENISTCSDVASPNIFFSLGKHAKLEVYNANLNAQIDAVLDAGSKMVFKNISAKISQLLHVRVKKDASFTFRHYSTGSSLDMKVQLLEENAEALLQGVICLENSAQSHVRTTVEHLAPYTQSRQHFKALLKGQSHSSFEGKIFVDPIAQKTQGYQLCNNLMLSDQATVNVRPNLEIFADDVKASHGATLGQLDKEALFYLTSRGFSKEAAKQYLIQGFIEELADCLP